MDEPKFSAYAFLHVVEPGGSVQAAITALRGLRPVVSFAHEYVGSFEGFAAVKADSFGEIQDVVTGFRHQDVRIRWSVTVRASIVLLAPHRRAEDPTTPMYEALVRVSSEPHRVKAVLGGIEDVYGPQVGREDFAARAAIVTGPDVDLLVQLMSTSLEELQRTLLDDLAPIEGIAAADTSFAFIESL